MLNIFEFLQVWENIESWLVYATKIFWITQPYFSTGIMKMKLMPASFSYFWDF